LNQAIETRELFTLNIAGVVIQGTYHLPVTSEADLSNRVRTGILFLAGFPMPRSAHGDAAVYWANSFADFGFPSFRVDLPGSGDSVGVVPADLLGFIIAGGYEAVVAAIMKELLERYNLTGIMVLGHCAGATSALFAAAASDECKGLMLLDPTFHLPPAARTKARRAMAHLATLNRIFGLLSNLHDRLKTIRLLLCRNAPPENANLPLLSRWKQLASAGLPILVLKAPGPKASGSRPRVGEFDYLNYVVKLAGSRSQVDVRIIEDAHHTFSSDLGRARVRQHVESWLADYFPLKSREGVVLKTAKPVLASNESIVEERESSFAGVDRAWRAERQ
jgi:pimeloyl-ACP methyl ester carboxylesterase